MRITQQIGAGGADGIFGQIAEPFHGHIRICRTGQHVERDEEMDLALGLAQRLHHVLFAGIIRHARFAHGLCYVTQAVVDTGIEQRFQRLRPAASKVAKIGRQFQNRAKEVPQFAGRFKKRAEPDTFGLGRLFCQKLQFALSLIVIGWNKLRCRFAEPDLTCLAFEFLACHVALLACGKYHGN